MLFNNEKEFQMYYVKRKETKLKRLYIGAGRVVQMVDCLCSKYKLHLHLCNWVQPPIPQKQKNVLYCMIPLIWPSEKGKTLGPREQINDSQGHKGMLEGDETVLHLARMCLCVCVCVYICVLGIKSRAFCMVGKSCASPQPWTVLWLWLWLSWLPAPVETHTIKHWKEQTPHCVNYGSINLT
jgi:hypothetical protein